MSRTGAVKVVSTCRRLTRMSVACGRPRVPLDSGHQEVHVLLPARSPALRCGLAVKQSMDRPKNALLFMVVLSSVMLCERSAAADQSWATAECVVHRCR